MKYSSMKQKGFSAIMAIVLVVLLALLGTTMATLTTTSFLNTTSSTLVSSPGLLHVAQLNGQCIQQ